MGDRPAQSGCKKGKPLPQTFTEVLIDEEEDAARGLVKQQKFSAGVKPPPPLH